MYILRIEHRVSDFDGWKSAFNSDPVGREQSGVRYHQILRSTDDPNHIMIDLEFNSKNEAEVLLAALREVWSRIEGTIIWDPQTRIVERVESKEY